MPSYRNTYAGELFFKGRVIKPGEVFHPIDVNMEAQCDYFVKTGVLEVVEEASEIPRVEDVAVEFIAAKPSPPFRLREED